MHDITKETDLANFKAVKFTISLTRGLGHVFCYCLPCLYWWFDWAAIEFEARKKTMVGNRHCPIAKPLGSSLTVVAKLCTGGCGLLEGWCDRNFGMATILRMLERGKS